MKIMETLTRYKPIIDTVLILGLLAFVALQWRGSVERAAEMAELRTSLKGMQQSIDDRQKQAAKANQSIDDKVAAAKSPEDYTSLIKSFGGLKQTPTIIVVPSAPQPTQAATSGSIATTPVPQVEVGDMVTKKDDIPVLLNTLANCQKQGNSLAACEQDKKDLQGGLDKAKNAVNGGSKMQRTMRVLFYSGCAGLGGGGGAAIGKEKGAAIGALGGVVACAIFGKGK